MPIVILWPPDVKSLLLGKDPDARKDWGQEEKVVTADEMVGWHHRLNGQEFEQALGDGEGQGGLVCCGPWVPKSQTELSYWTTIKSFITAYKAKMCGQRLLYSGPYRVNNTREPWVHKRTEKQWNLGGKREKSEGGFRMSKLIFLSAVKHCS